MSRVPTERTGRGDPARTIELLWRGLAPERRGRGPRPRHELPDISAAAVDLADAEGLAAVTMRGLASRLGLASPMALYTYVPGKGELIDLMVDACFADFVLDTAGTPSRIAGRIRAIADANRVLYEQHRWLADVSTDRPPLGPGQLRKYELELAALDGLGLTDHEMDLTLGLVLTLVRAHAISATDPSSSGEEEAAWWATAGPALAAYVDGARYPLASRVGTAVGEQQGRAHDPDVAYAFGLDRIADGVRALRDDKGDVSRRRPRSRAPRRSSG
jgi:AcrR family transcriptional regulator